MPSAIQATRLADELRSEQEHVVHIEKVRISLETQVKEYQVKLDEVEAMALKGGQRQIEKLQNRVRSIFRRTFEGVGLTRSITQI